MIISITGQLAVLRYYSTNGIYIQAHPGLSGEDNYQETFGFIYSLKRPRGVSLLKTRQFFHSLFTEENNHPVPVHCEVQELGECTVRYEVPDSPKVGIQMLDATHELDRLPAWKVADYLLVDGQRIDMIQDPAGYNIRPGFEFTAWWPANS